MSDPLRTDLVVLDVDNTLFDWVRIWSGAFDAMIQSLVAQTDVAAVEWLARVRAVHVRRGMVECATVLEDLALSPAWPAGVDAAVVVPRAVAAYRRYWDVHLAPYPGVREMLTGLALRGVQVVAYTESDAAIAAARLTRLGLAGVIRKVFGRATSHTGARREWSLVPLAARSPIAIDVIPQQDTKPNPLGLRSILARCGVDSAHAVYVGDDVATDIAMARPLGVRAFWAAYGAERQPHDIERLEQVSCGSLSITTRASGHAVTAMPPELRLAHPLALLDMVGAAAASAA